jgi:hypothetical protein
MRFLAIAFMAVSLVLVGLVPVQAQTPIVEADFDATFPTFGYSYDYSGRGDPVLGNVDTSNETSAFYDVNTPPAATATMDASQWMIPVDATYTYAGWGLGIGFVLPGDVALTSGDLSDYSVTFDVSVSGYDPLDDGLNLDIQFILQAPDDDDEDSNAEHYTLMGNSAGLGLLPSTTETETVTITADQLTVSASEYDFPTAFADTFILILQVQPNVNADEIGTDADNVITVDNVRFDGPTGAPASADFDGDDDVDNDDLATWAGAFGTGTEGDADGDFDSDGADFLIWQRQLGSGLPALAAVQSVPEPCGVAQFAMIGCGLALARQRRR